MTLLILGVLLWWIVHSFPIFGHPQRQALVARMGENPYKGVYSLLILASVVLMVIGYRGADYVHVYAPPSWGLHLNNLLMVIAVALFGASHSKGNAKRFVRHPQLSAVTVWGVAHLLANGDLASVILFGGLAVWAVVAMVGTNRRDGAWVKPAPAPLKKDLILVAITLVLFVVIVVLHGWLGRWPLPG